MDLRARAYSGAEAIDQLVLDTSAYSHFRAGHAKAFELIARAGTAIVPMVVFGALRRAGTSIPVNDIWIAATTLELGGHLLSFDRGFRRVTGLRATILQPARAPARG